jgi:hypothetical protein
LETISEQLFRELCEQIGIRCDRVAVAEGAGERRPDFRVIGHQGTSIFVETKQFDPSPEEQEQISRTMRGETVVRGGMPGGRLREVIGRANAQLKALSQGRSPGLLVVYNNVFGGSYHTDPYAVLTAMRGLDIVPVIVPRDPRESPTFLDARPGPKRKLRPDANTHVSAIAVLYMPPTAKLGLLVYHNPHARTPLAVADLHSPAVDHFLMLADQSGWEPTE